MTVKRNSPRFPVNIDVHFSLNGGEEMIGRLVTASPYGVFLSTDVKLQQEDSIEIILPIVNFPLHVVGRIAWVSTGEPCGAGIEFQELDDEARAAIVATIESGYWLVDGAPSETVDEPDIFSVDTDEIIADLGDE